MLFGIPSGASSSGSAIPWYQQPSYSGTGLPSSSVVLGRGVAGRSEQQSAVGAAPLQVGDATPSNEEFYCDSCEKEFSQESQYNAHVATHVTCSFTGCKFVGSQRVVKEHIQMTHGENKAVKSGREGTDGSIGFKISLETPEEIARWREDRARNWPSNANIKRRLEAESRRQSRGQPEVPPCQNGRQKGPAWKLKPSASSNQRSKPSPTLNRRGADARQQKQDEFSFGPNGGAQACSMAQSFENAEGQSDCVVAVDASADLLGLGCYDSDDNENAPHVFANGQQASAQQGLRVASEACFHSTDGNAKEEDVQTEPDRNRPPRQQSRRGGSESYVAREGYGAEKGKKRARGTGDGYVGHGRIERRGGALLGRLLKDDGHRQDGLLLQAIRHMSSLLD